ncbi:MAG: MBL fold metallo-hydrolase, partial [Chloroflexota bacterium]|nr:MBL fold metallo-hydrolase [Chloroflexota bacterium]
MSPLTRISEHLYVYEDTCLSYALVDGERALLVDCGSGFVLEALEEIGVRQVEWVLHTHHHRDQCQGDWMLVEHGASLAVPEREAHLFEDVETFWANRQVMDNYALGSDGFALATSVPVATRLQDYGTFKWRSYEFQVLPAPGHTKGSVSLLTQVDGAVVAFTGDLIAAPGRVWHVYDMQWQYGGGLGVTEGLQTASLSLLEVLRAKPDLLLPSHGAVMREAATAVGALIERMRELHRWTEGSAWTARPAGLVVDRHLERISDHLWMNQYSLAHSYAVIADNGDGLLLDYGYPSLSHFSGEFRFAEHSLPELFARAGLKRVDLFIPSHYHDDHIAGVPLLQAKYGARVWAHEVMTDLLRHPHAYSLPCLLPSPIRVERELLEGEEFEWNGFRFHTAHTPGHTYYQAALFGEIDGLRVAHTGDNVYAGPLGPMLGGPIY